MAELVLAASLDDMEVMGARPRGLREIAVEDLSPWVKLGDIVLRATRVTASAKSATVEARVHDRAVLRELRRAFGGDDVWSSADELAVTFLDESGRAASRTCQLHRRRALSRT